MTHAATKARPDDTLLPPPTAEVRRLVQIVGPAAALKLIERRGGTRIYVPKQPSAWLVEALGEAAAAALAEAMGGDDLQVPLGRAWRVLVYDAQGLSQAAIALRLGCVVRSVRRILARFERTRSQLDLFAS
jgi:hypothetical protein